MICLKAKCWYYRPIISTIKYYCQNSVLTTFVITQTTMPNIKWIINNKIKSLLVNVDYPL